MRSVRARLTKGARGAGALAALLVASLLAGCEADQGAVPQRGDDTRAAVDRTLTFAVFGPVREVDAYRSLVAVYNSLYDDAEMEVEGYSSRQEFMGTVRESGEVPDVFLASRRDLKWLEDNEVTQPVDQLLVERGVDFGDLYSRDSVLAFSAESRLQCMPVGISPMVMFYNSELVDFDAMVRRGLSAPAEEGNSWNFSQFTAAAEFASRPARGTKGIYVDPTLEGLAPWIYAGDGQVFDSPTEPTRLAFSDDGTIAALETVLPVLRDPRLTLTPAQLERRSAVEWFERGKLAMMPGYRSLVPRLRDVPGLEWDVIQMPSVERNATIGDLTGMCVSSETRNATAAADFLVHMSSAVSVRRIASEGYLVPANLEVAYSTDFLQPGRAPDHGQVFTNAIRSIVLVPLLDDEPELELTVADELEELLLAPVLTDLEGLATSIDEESRTILDPEGLAEEEQTESPTESPSDTESP
jgi:multiple sugar transport system substrate-binding protein